MQCIVMYAIGIYSPLSQINSEFFFFNFGHLISGHSISREQGCEDPRLFFEAKGIREQNGFANTDLKHS
jgi:hypothetical protein